jgi:hypothetical protein
MVLIEKVVEHQDGHFYRECTVCEQSTLNGRRGYGPWCELYCRERGELCYAKCAHDLLEADNIGDGPKVNALARYGRARYGECIYW